MEVITQTQGTTMVNEHAEHCKQQKPATLSSVEES